MSSNGKNVEGQRFGEGHFQSRVPCSSILLGNVFAALPFLPQKAIEFRIHKLVPLAKVLALAALVTHPKFPENSSGRGIVMEMRGENPMQVQIFKAIADQFPRCLRRVALAPVGSAEPVSEFGMLMFRIQTQSGAAVLPAVTAQRNRQP